MENQPDFSANIDKRIKVFEKVIQLSVEGSFYKSQVFENLSDTQKDQFDRLQNDYDLGTTLYAGKQIARFGFLSRSKLHYRIKEQCFNIFFEHFPDGLQTSLIGYPQNNIYSF